MASVNSENFQCFRNPGDGSMYYGEVAYIRRENGVIVKSSGPIYEAEIKSLSEE